MGVLLNQHIIHLLDEKDPVSLKRQDKAILYIKRICKCGEDAFDIFYETLCVLLSSKEPENIRRIENFDRYLFTCLKHQSFKWIRKSVRHQEIQSEILNKIIEEELKEKGFQNEENEKLIHLKAALSKLSDIDFRILWAFYCDNFEWHDIASELNEDGFKPKRNAAKFTADITKKRKERLIKKMKEQWIMTIE